MSKPLHLPPAMHIPEDPIRGHPRYEQVKFLNRGAYGFVLLGRDKETGAQVALKFIERGPQKINKYVEREVKNHMKLRHPCIVALHEVFLTEEHLVLAMEYAGGGDLEEYVSERGGLPEEEARWFFQQLIVAVDYCQRQGVANRDIKLENTLLTRRGQRPTIKLADFGFSKDEKMQSKPGTRIGTPAYLAPEVILAVPGQTYDGKVADIWSCGVMLYAMLVAAYPFERPLDRRDTQQRMLQRTMRAEYDIPPDIRLSAECKDLLARMLTPDPTKRITIMGIQQHPWYLKDLPPGVMELNDSLPHAQIDPKMEAQLQAVLREAQSVVGHGKAMRTPTGREPAATRPWTERGESIIDDLMGDLYDPAD